MGESEKSSFDDDASFVDSVVSAHSVDHEYNNVHSEYNNGSLRDLKRENDKKRRNKKKRKKKRKKKKEKTPKVQSAVITDQNSIDIGTPTNTPRTLRVKIRRRSGRRTN